MSASVIDPTGRPRTSRVQRYRHVAVLTAVTMALASAGTAIGGLVSGTLPAAGFTFMSSTVNDVSIAGHGLHLRTRGGTDVKTTYSRIAPTGALLGWHWHHGPVIVSVAVGTLTVVGADCQTWDLTAGDSYIESPGEILNAYADPAKNEGVASVEWFSTRLLPPGAGDPVPVDPPCDP